MPASIAYAVFNGTATIAIDLVVALFFESPLATESPSLMPFSKIGE